MGKHKHVGCCEVPLPKNPFVYPVGAHIAPGDESVTADSYGMTLRDWFAGQAIRGLADKPMGHDSTARQYAAVAYRLADAMLAEREKEGEG